MHRFVLSDDVYTTVDIPDSTRTSIYPIHAKGAFVVEFDDADFNQRIQWLAYREARALLGEPNRD